MKKLLITAYSLFLASFLTSGVFAQNEMFNLGTPEFFTGVGLGYTSDLKSTSSGVLDGDSYEDFIYSLEVGAKWDSQYNFNNVVSLEFLYSNYDGNQLDVSNYGFMLNYKLEYEFHPYVLGYLGAGVGVVNSTGDFNASLASGANIRIEGDESVFAYQFLAGLETKPFEQIGVYAQYRYLSGADLEGLDFTAMEGHFVELGLRFYF